VVRLARENRQCLVHDRDSKFCPVVQRTIDAAGVKRVVLPPKSPNLNAYAERRIRSLRQRTTMGMTA
jgi:putative transposase